MTQALYEHMNNKTIKIFKKEDIPNWEVFHQIKIWPVKITKVRKNDIQDW
jgi:hypothetical protein